MKDVLARRERLLLDAAMGTALLVRGFDPARETAASWNLSHPDEVLAVHRAHVRAGADVVLTNTFGAEAPEPEQCEMAVALARRSGARFVAGSLWAGAKRLAAAVADLSRADAIWLETATSMDQAEAALTAVRERTTLPVIVTVAIFPPPPSLAGLKKLGADAVGVNCSPWPKGRLAELTRGLDVVKPDASGLVPAEWAAEVRACDVPLLGGCCGTTADHLAALRATPR